MLNKPTAGHALAGTNLTLAYDARVISTDLDLAIPSGKITVIIGPNACGKSTALRALARLLKPKTGQVTLGEKPVASYSAKAFARQLALLPQTATAPFGISVADLVARGRFPHQKMLQQWSPEDEIAVAMALEATGITDLTDRQVEELSGGQRQRVWIALLLAQDAPVMLLDEPTTFLDVAHQLEVLELVQQLNRCEGRTIALVLHDLNQAARFADNLVVLKDGAVVAQGPPQEIMTEEILAHAFNLKARVITDPVFGSPMVIPISCLRTTAAAQLPALV